MKNISTQLARVVSLSVLSFSVTAPSYAALKFNAPAAKSEPASKADAKQVLAKMDGSAGDVEFKATGHPSAIKIEGKGSAPTGQFVIGQHQVSGSASFDVASLQTGIGMRDEHMKDKYLEVKKYPKATLTLTKLELPANVDASKGDFSAKAVSFEGKMNFHGVERPVKGTADIAAKGGSANVNAQFEMKCGEYAINQPSFAGITMADGVQVNVNGVAKILPN